MYLHGGGTMTGFDALLPLAEQRPADRARSTRASAQSADDPSIDSLHDYHLHYLDLFDKLGLDEISLAGHSLGGALAANFAILEPRRVRRLVLVAPWGLRVPEHPTVDIFSIPDEQILEYLVADLTPFAGMPMPPPPEFLAERYREATSLRARALEAALRPQAPRSGCTASQRRRCCSGATPTASSRSSRRRSGPTTSRTRRCARSPASGI